MPFKNYSVISTVSRLSNYSIHRHCVEVLLCLFAATSDRFWEEVVGKNKRAWSGSPEMGELWHWYLFRNS